MSDSLVKIVSFDPPCAVKRKEKLVLWIFGDLVKTARRPADLSNGIHLDCSKLVREGKLSQKDGARLHITLASGR